MNRTMPAMKPRFCPARSASRPIGTRSAAYTTAYALRIQLSSESSVPPKSRPIWSKATLTMKRSTPARNAAPINTAVTTR